MCGRNILHDLANDALYQLSYTPVPVKNRLLGGLELLARKKVRARKKRVPAEDRRGGSASGHYRLVPGDRFNRNDGKHHAVANENAPVELRVTLLLRC